MKALKDHSLSLALVLIWFSFDFSSWLVWDDKGGFRQWWGETFNEWGGGAFGALVIVLLTKWLREVGSVESK